MSKSDSWHPKVGERVAIYGKVVGLGHGRDPVCVEREGTPRGMGWYGYDEVSPLPKAGALEAAARPAPPPTLAEAMARAMACHFSMNRMPHMSGDPLNRLGSQERRRLDDATEAALTALCAARPDVAALLAGEATAVRHHCDEA